MSSYSISMTSKTLNFPIVNKHHVCCGIDGLSYYGAFYAAIVVVDVLTFCTTVDIAISKDSTIIPTALEDDSLLRPLAEKQNAILAGKRGNIGITLSPASMQSLQPKQKILLPSLNGSPLINLASKFTKPVFTGCLRNSEALAKLLMKKHYFPILFVAAGEKFPNRTLRPSIEDYWGVGSILALLNGEKTMEAQCAEKSFDFVSHNLKKALIASESGQELCTHGYQEDVEVAADFNASNRVGILLNNEGSLELTTANSVTL